MRITTWNVNGLVPTLQYYPWSETKSFKTLLDALEADIICLQEVKCQRSKLTKDMALVPGYDCYLSFSKRRLGYSGVAVYVKQPLKPIACEEGITGILNSKNNNNNNSNSNSNSNNSNNDNDSDISHFLETLDTPSIQLDDEGRCLILDFKEFILLNIYFPNDAEGARTTFKMDYHRTVQKRIEHMIYKENREVVLVGDVNALYAELDHFAPKQDIKERGLDYFNQLPHREWLHSLVAPQGPLVDVTRFYHPNRQGMFTVWNTKLNARASNMGTRIDYILVTKQLASKVSYSDIQPDIKGSDHCPVYANFDIELQQNIQEPLTTPLLTSNYVEFSAKQKKVSSYFQLASSSKETETNRTDVLKGSSSQTSSLHKPQIITNAISTSQPTLNNIVKKRKTIDSFFSTNKKKKEEEKSELEKMMEIQNKGAYPDEFKIAVGEDEEDEGEKKKKKEEADTKWTNLFKPPDVPLCDVHKAKCLERIVTKKGPNQGRTFYVCSKPVGPPGDDTNKELYSCNYFKWKKNNK